MLAELTLQLNYARFANLLPVFERVAKEQSIPVAVLLAVASQETGIGSSSLLTSNYTGDSGHGRGIMQIDDRWHSLFTSSTANNNHYANISYGAKLIKSEYAKYRNWRDTFDAYNSGRTGDDLGVEYAEKVLARKDAIEKIYGKETALAGSSAFVISGVLLLTFILSRK